MHVTLRIAEKNDLGTILSWIPDADACRVWAGPDVCYPANATSVWKTIKADNNNTYSLVGIDGSLVGFGQILRRGARVVHLARIIVDPRLRGSGYGRLLCKALMKTAGVRFAVHRFTLHVYAENHAAITLYRSLGFETETNRAANTVLFMSKTPNLLV